MAKILLDDLALELDRLFALEDSDPDPGFSRFLPRAYQEIDCDYSALFEPDFCARFNGLMFRSGDFVHQVYCAAFPSPDILDRILTTTSGDALLFLHHPIDLEVSGAGFLPIFPHYLEQLRACGVSVYACHAPLDCHDRIGTNASIVQAFAVKVERSFAPYGNGFAGRIGIINPTGLDELIARGKEVFSVSRVEIGGAKPTIITRVAIVAGGGDEVELMEEAEHFGAGAYITGEWYTRTLPRDEAGKTWAHANREACLSYAATSSMALLAFSHAASEHLVMQTHMTDYFQAKGLPVECLQPSDWWR